MNKSHCSWTCGVKPRKKKLPKENISRISGTCRWTCPVSFWKTWEPKVFCWAPSRELTNISHLGKRKIIQSKVASKRFKRRWMLVSRRLITLPHTSRIGESLWNSSFLVLSFCWRFRLFKLERNHAVSGVPESWTENVGLKQKVSNSYMKLTGLMNAICNQVSSETNQPQKILMTFH